jgi:cobalt-zinc-cadmium efflux system protein
MGHEHDHSCAHDHGHGNNEHGHDAHAHGGHDHAHHGHAHGAGGLHRKAITAAFLITASFMLVEFAGGLLTGSMALLSDSMHMLTDAAALGMSFFASRLAALKPDSARTFGYRRAEVVAALANAMLLWILSGYMLREVYERFYNPVPVMSGPMIWVAVAGLLANVACAWILHAHSGDNINIRGAFLHVLSDLAGSVAAIVAGVIIYFTGFYRADTIVSLLIIGLILVSSARLLSEAFHILMEGAPRGLSLKALDRELRGIDGVSDVHELHAWSLSSGFNALSAHLVVKDPAKQQAALKKATCEVAASFGIRHSVFQVESEPVENSSCDICV